MSLLTAKNTPLYARRLISMCERPESPPSLWIVICEAWKCRESSVRKDGALLVQDVESSAATVLCSAQESVFRAYEGGERLLIV